jgi:non-specific protein-tyrosine kinase
MEIRKYADILWRWAWLLTLGMVLAGVTGFITSKLQTPVYQASSTLLVSEGLGGGNYDAYSALLTSQQLTSTYVKMMTTRTILQEVAARVQVPIEKLEKMIDVQVVRDTQLITVVAEDTDPSRAAAVANILPKVFRDYSQSTQSIRFTESKQNLTVEIAKLDQQLADTQSRIADLGQPQDVAGTTLLDRLQADLAQQRQNRTVLLQSLENLRLVEAQSLNNVVIVDMAAVPTKPVGPRILINTALAAVVGLLLALALAFLVEYLDDTIKGPDQATALLKLPVIGVVARLSKDELSRGPVAIVAPRSPAAEAFRSLRTNLQFASIDRPLRRLLVTSGGPAEGKSIVVTNLATVFAQAGLSVVVVDADLRRPSQNKQFGLSRRVGLSELLLHEPLGLNGALQTTDAPNLSLLTTGTLPPNPTELLGSQKMKALLDLVNEQANLVILDSPPASAVADATILASEVDGVILVIEVGRTRVAAAVHAKTLLERAGAKLLGVVLNKAPLHRRGYYYQNYSYYYQQEPSDGDGPNANGHRPFPLNLLPGLKRKRKNVHGNAGKKAVPEQVNSTTILK